MFVQDEHDRVFRLLIATRNKGKLREFRTLLAGLPIEACSLDEFPGVPEADEPFETFRDNARHKARFYAARTGALALADDSGLEVDALGGAPGVRSARYGGGGLTSDERNRLLLRELAFVAEADRGARFRCAIAVARPDANIVLEAEGTCEGHIASAPRGANGFGYDPIFLPEGHTAAFAELDAAIKDRISHRGHAARRARELLAAWLARGVAP